MVIPDAGAVPWAMCPGARTAGLGGPCGRMKRKKTKNIEITVLMAMRRVIDRLAMVAEGQGNLSPDSRVETAQCSKVQLEQEIKK